MNKDLLREYLDTRRRSWPYEGRYSVLDKGEHRFVAQIDGQLAGLSYAEIIEDGSEARMRMNLKKEYAEYGIGTELLELLMEDLQKAGYSTIRYEIGKEYYAFQIYQNLGFEVDYQDTDIVKFVWKR